jgi:hypothetical protein
MTYTLDESHNSQNFTPADQVLSVFGYPRIVKWITIHHWGVNGQQFDVVRDFLCTNTTPTSAHYVVEAGQAACIVNETDAAWHAGNALGNAQSIGIECHPEATDADYQTIAEVIRDIRSRFGDVPLVAHNYWTATDCPGDYDLARLDRLARVTAAQSTTVTPIQEATLSAAEVTQIITAINASEARVKDYLAKLLVGTWSNADGDHAGVWPVVVANQRRIDALAKTPAPAPAPVTLTDAQVAQIIAAIPAASLAAFRDQINK